MPTPTRLTRRRALAIGGMSASLLFVRPKLGYGDVGLEGQAIYAADTTGRADEVVVLTQTESGNSQLRLATIDSDGSTTVGRRLDNPPNDGFAALDMSSNQTQASALIGTVTELAQLEDTNDFDDLTEDERTAIDQEPDNPYGVPITLEYEVNRPAGTTGLTETELDIKDGIGVLLGRNQLGKVTLEVILRPDGDEGDHLNQLDVVVNGSMWTLTQHERLLGTATVYARSNERPFVVADTEGRELLIWQVEDEGWVQLASLEDAEPNTAQLNTNGELVAWRGGENEAEPVTLRNNTWVAADSVERRPVSAGAIPVRNGGIWLSTDQNGQVKAIEVNH